MNDNERLAVRERIKQILGIQWAIPYIAQQEAHHVSDDEFSEGEEEFYEEEYFDDQ